MNPRRLCPKKTDHRDGFTFVELLVVLATTALLLVFLLPAMATTKPNSQRFQCLNNQRQLALGWNMYSNDNQGALPINAGVGDQPPTPTSSTDPQWCPGRMDAGSGTQPTNALWLKAGQIYPYVNSVGVYHCPADTSTYDTAQDRVYGVNGPGNPRVRTMSMNGYINGPTAGYTFTANFLVYRKESALVHPGPANLWLFIDENPYSINDAFFVNNPSNDGNPPAGTTWTDCPGSCHNGACGMAFCDGHAIIKQWHDSTVLHWSHLDHNGYAAASPGANKHADLDWLLNQSTYYK